MIKTEYLGWQLSKLTMHPAAQASSRWSCRYDNHDLLIVGWGHTPESALASAQKQIKLREGVTKLSVDPGTLPDTPLLDEVSATPIADGFDDMAAAAYKAADTLGYKPSTTDAFDSFIRDGNMYAEAAENARRLKL